MSSEASNPVSASRTAAMVAALRARLTEKQSCLVDDPYAARLCADDGYALADELSVHYPPIELWVGLRTAYLDRLLRQFLLTGEWGSASSEAAPGQVVVLGAGYDARAARFSGLPARFFEVDQPHSQRSKLERIRCIDYPPDAATYVSCDFEHDDFLDGLADAGLDLAKPALFVWEGVTPYLTENAVRRTARRIASGMGAQAVLVFDYLGKKMLANAGSLDPSAAASKTMVANLGEPVIFGINDVLPLLSEAGFGHVVTQNFDSIALSFGHGYRRDRLFRFQHVAVAAKAPPRWLTTPVKAT